MGADGFLCVGIVGGMSPESTVTYYRHIVRRHQAEFGDHGYPRVVIASVSFQQYVGWQHEGDWGRIAENLAREFRAVSAAGADFAVLATNTMHKVLPLIESPVPVLSVFDAVARRAAGAGVEKIGLTGTKFTMSDGFYAAGLERRGLKALLPARDEQEAIHRIIYDELILGRVDERSVRRFTEIGEGLLRRGAEAVLLGCTELELLVRERDFKAKTIDSTLAHADAAWEAAVGRGPL
jgi:aspartate racemase